MAGIGNKGQGIGDKDKESMVEKPFADFDSRQLLNCAFDCNNSASSATVQCVVILSMDCMLYANLALIESKLVETGRVAMPINHLKNFQKNNGRSVS